MALWAITFAANAAHGSDDNQATPVEVLARQDIARSKFIGRLIGTGAGIIVGSNTKLGAANGAALGGAAGDAVGEHVVGKHIANRRRKFVVEGDSIEREIRSSRRAVEAKRKEINRLRDDLRETEEEVSKLQRERKENEDVSDKAAATLKELNDQISNDGVQLKTYQEAISYQSEVIGTLNNQKQPTAGLESKRNELIAARAELRQDYQALEGIDRGYRTQRSRLKPIVERRSSHPVKSDRDDTASRVLKAIQGN